MLGGLLDFNLDNLDDPKKLALLQAGLSMMQGAPGRNKDFAADFTHGLQQGLLGLQMGKDAQFRREGAMQQRKMADLQFQEAQQRMGDQQFVRDAFKRNVTPGMPQMQPTDMETPSGPTGPSSLNMGGLQRDLMGSPAGLPMLAQLSQMGQRNIKTFKPGERAVDMGSGREVYAAPPEAPKPPAGFTMGPDGRLAPDPNWMDAQLKLRQAGRHQVSVNTNMPPLERREQGDKGALNIKNFGDIQTSAATARKENAVLTALEKIPLDTGKLTPANATVSAWIAAMGGSKRFQDVAAQGEAFTGFAKELVLQKQLARKGPQTESDARRLEQTVASLGNTPQANAVLITFSKAANKRIIEQEKFYNDWWKKKGTMEGADDAWINGKGGTSIWDEPELKKIQSSGGTLKFDREGNQIQ